MTEELKKNPAPEQTGENPAKLGDDNLDKVTGGVKVTPENKNLEDD